MVAPHSRHLPSNAAATVAHVYMQTGVLMAYRVTIPFAYACDSDTTLRINVTVREIPSLECAVAWLV